MFYINWTYISLVLPAVLIAMWASSRVNSTFKKYSSVASRSGYTGYSAARALLDAKGLYHIKIERVSGKLTDHFDPKSNVIRLSENVYSSTSCSAIGVACHEAGHAMQYAEKYLPIRVRNAIVPITNFGSKLSTILILVGVMFSYLGEQYSVIAYIGVALYSFTVIFQLVTLPTEFNASKRALQAIDNYRILDETELGYAKKVLTAAALTYVAALAVSLSQFIYLLTLVNRRR